MKTFTERKKAHHFKPTLAFFLVLLLGGASCVAVIKMANSSVSINSELDTRPLITSEPLQPIEYTTQIAAAGVLTPAEQTDIAFEINGKVNWLHEAFIEGGIVNKGTLLASLDDYDYQITVVQQQAALASAEAQLAEEIARAKVAKEEWAKSPDPTPIALREPQVASAKAQVKAARAMLELAQKNLARTRYYAPYDALITQRNTGLGQVIRNGETLGQIVNLSFGEIRVPIASFDRPFLPGLPAENVTIIADTRHRAGTLTRHTGQFSATTRMASYIVRVDDPYAIQSDLEPLYFGQFFEIQIPGKTLTNVLKLPQEWVRNNRVWLVNSEQTLIEQPVNVLRQEQNHVLITAELQHNSRIVKQLPEYPQHGMLVREQSSSPQLALAGAAK